ncbi:MAG: ROK family protein [Treponema sp.]|jgi:predicted NBD/HSP70 family sugar kinase|nr:ROK family protein [Treponema sp.]
MPGYNLNNVKTNNRYEIIQKIYQNVDINRNHITREMGLTNSAVTKIINSLINEKYISEKNYLSAIRNRRARYLSICEGSFGVITLYFGRHGITAAIADICGKIIYSRDYTITYSMMDEVILNEIVDETVKNVSGGLSCLGCIGVTPGIRSDGEAAGDTEALQEKSQAPYFWDMQKLDAILKDKYHIPLFTENDSNIALLGEKWFGKGKNTDNFVLYNIGRGIGSSVCIQGKLLRGYHNSSIEIGHVTINFEGPDCDCGNRGCLELYTGMDNWEKKLEDIPKYAGQQNRLEALFLNARQGDNESRRLFDQYARMIAEGALILATMFSPEKIIVTTNEADFFHLPPIIEIVKKEINTRTFSTRRQKICVEDSDLRKTGYILGGIALVLEKQLFAA